MGNLSPNVKRKHHTCISKDLGVCHLYVIDHGNDMCAYRLFADDMSGIRYLKKANRTLKEASEMLGLKSVQVAKAKLPEHFTISGLVNFWATQKWQALNGEVKVPVMQSGTKTRFIITLNDASPGYFPWDEWNEQFQGCTLYEDKAEHDQFNPKKKQRA